MNINLKGGILAVVLASASPAGLLAQSQPESDANTGASQVDGRTGATQTRSTEPALKRVFSHLSVGGYGEAVMSRNFYSQHFNRYKYPERYADDDSHGRFDLPHVVINLGYDFGYGWTTAMEIEFEHGGTESAVEMDADESGEYEAETEKGGEVALEQFWIQKSFFPALNLRAGEIVVPVGATNAHHLPTEFFTCYRPEGEATILPCTWHQVGISLWGQAAGWRYEAQFLSGLDAERFGAECFVHYASNSSYEFKIANKYAAALRVDNNSIDGLRLSLSGYAGRTFRNQLKTPGSKYDDVEGGLLIGCFDFAFERFGIIARGNYDIAHLDDADLITTYNVTYPKHSGQDGTPSKRQPVAEEAMAAGVEAGYDFFSLSDSRAQRGQRLIVFGRFEHYDSMKKSTNASAYEWCGKNRFALGLNYFPLKEIVVKAEYSKRNLPDQYNDEPSVSLGIAYSGWFK